MASAVRRAQERTAPDSHASHPVDTSTAIRATLKHATEALARNLDGVLDGEGGAIHQFHISVRRLRGLIELYHPVLPQNWVNHCGEELRFLGRSIGALRDCDVLRENLADASAEIDEPLRDDLTPLLDTLAERRRKQHEEACTMLRSPRYQALLQSLQTVAFKHQQSPDGGIALPKLLRPMVRAVERADARLRRHSSPSEFHRLRIRIKRLRYVLEMTGGGKRKHGKRTARKLRRVQEVLGAQHDLVGAMGWLRELAASATIPGPSLLASGALYEVLRRRSRSLSRRAWKKWKTTRDLAIFQDIGAAIPANVHVLNDGDTSGAEGGAVSRSPERSRRVTSLRGTH